MSNLASNASRCGRGEEFDPEPGFATKVCVLFLGRCRRSPSPNPLGLSPLWLCLLRLPAATGGGYWHSRPEFSHDRQVVPTPLFTHLTFERRQRIHAMLERIRPRSVCPGDCPAAGCPEPEVVWEAVAVAELAGGPSVACREWRRESAPLYIRGLLSVEGGDVRGGRCCARIATAEGGVVALEALESQRRNRSRPYRLKAPFSARALELRSG